jgi:hypothetical protein
MAFCGNCGSQLQGDERFCVKCGHDVRANGTAAPGASAPAAVASAPAATASATAHPAAAAPPAQYAAPQQQYAAPQPVVAAPPHYAMPGQVPVGVGVPPAPAKKNGLMWLIVAVAVVGLGYYYHKSHSQTTTTQPGPATPGANPSQPGSAPQPGVAVQPGDPGPSSASLVQAQHFSGQWRVVNGSVEVYDLRWTNGSNEVMQSSVLECDQYSANDEVLAQFRTTLNGPVQAGGVGTYNPFMMGAEAQGLKAVNCAFVGATPAG